MDNNSDPQGSFMRQSTNLLGNRNDGGAGFNSQATLHPAALLRRPSAQGQNLSVSPPAGGLMRRGTMMGKKLDDALVGGPVAPVSQSNAAAPNSMLSNLFSNAFLKKYQPHISTQSNPFTVNGEVRHQIAQNTTINPEPTVVS